MTMATAIRWLRNRRPGAQVVALTVALAVGSAACGGNGRPDVAATVAGRQVRSAEVERLTGLWMSSHLRQEAERHAGQVAKGQAGGQASASGPGSLERKEVARLVLGYLVRRTLLEELAAARRIKLSDDARAAAAAGGTPEAELAALGWDRDQIEGSFAAGELSRLLGEQIFREVAVTEGEMRERYDRQPEVFARSWQAQVKSAQFDKEAPVALLKDAVGRGEAFEMAASRLGSRENLDLGMVNSVRELPEPIRAALEGLQAGMVSAPVPVKNGFVALFVESREDLPGLTFDEARPELQALLADEKRQSLFTDWFDKQLTTARVEVADHYGRWDRSSGQVE